MKTVSIILLIVSLITLPGCGPVSKSAKSQSSNKLDTEVTVDLRGKYPREAAALVGEQLGVPLYVRHCRHYGKPLYFAVNNMKAENAFFWCGLSNGDYCMYDQGKLFVGRYEYLENPIDFPQNRRTYDQWSAAQGSTGTQDKFKKIISVDYKSTPLKEVISELSSLCGYPIVGHRDIIEGVPSFRSKTKQKKNPVTVTYKAEERQIINVINDICRDNVLTYCFVREALFICRESYDFKHKPPKDRKTGSPLTGAVLKKKVSFSFLELGIYCAFSFVNRVSGLNSWAQYCTPHQLTLRVGNMQFYNSLFWIAFLTDRVFSIQKNRLLIGRPEHLSHYLLFPKKGLAYNEWQQRNYKQITEKTKSCVLKTDPFFEKKISHDFKAIPLTDVFQVLFKSLGYTYIIDPGLEHTQTQFTGAIESEPVIDAAESICSEYGLGCSFIRGAVFIHRLPYDPAKYNGKDAMAEGTADIHKFLPEDKQRREHGFYTSGHPYKWPEEIKQRVAYLSYDEYVKLKQWVRLYSERKGWSLLPPKTIAENEDWKTVIRINSDDETEQGAGIDDLSFDIDIITVKKPRSCAFDACIMENVNFKDLVLPLTIIGRSNSRAEYRIHISEQVKSDKTEKRVKEMFDKAGIASGSVNLSYVKRSKQSLENLIEN